MHSRPISTLSFAHPAASTSERAAIATALGDPRSAARSLQKHLDGAEVFVLITCLRVEIASDAPGLTEAVSTLVGATAANMTERSGINLSLIHI